MALIIKKNIVPRFEGDTKASLDFLKQVQQELDVKKGQNLDGVIIDFGVEAIIRLSDMGNLRAVAEELEQCKDQGYLISLHAPINPSDPAKVDLTTDEGFRVAEELTQFADRNGIGLIVAHPNTLRSPEHFYGLIDARVLTAPYINSNLDILIESVSKLNRDFSNVKFTIENKPYPATDEKNEGVIYSILCAQFGHIFRLKEAGIPITFDTAHYAITRATINGALATHKLKGKPLSLIIDSMLGLFKEDFIYQPNIEDALTLLGKSVEGIHLNDAGFYQNVNGMNTYWEGLVPGKGSLVNYRDVTNYLKHESKIRDISLVMEVYEKDYKKCPNAFETFKDFLVKLRD